MANKEVVGYVLSSDTNLIAEMAQSDYTTVILCFLVGDGGGKLTPSVELQAVFNSESSIKELKKAGKRVLVSVGGEGFSTAAWAALANNVDETVSQLAGIVQMHNLDGVDIDWEDTFFSGYDATAFLVDLSRALKSKLPADHNFVTHAPQAPYFYGDPSGSYMQIYVDVAKNAGDDVDLYNIQYYNNPWYVGGSSEEEAGKVAGVVPVDGAIFPSSITGIAASGVPASKLILGKPTSTENAQSGYLPATQIAESLIQPLMEKDPNFAGVMGWQYPTQYGADQGTDDWAGVMAQALNGPRS